MEGEGGEPQGEGGPGRSRVVVRVVGEGEMGVGPGQAGEVDLGEGGGDCRRPEKERRGDPPRRVGEQLGDHQQVERATVEHHHGGGGAGGGGDPGGGVEGEAGGEQHASSEVEEASGEGGGREGENEGGQRYGDGRAARQEQGGATDRAPAAGDPGHQRRGAAPWVMRQKHGEEGRGHGDRRGGGHSGEGVAEGEDDESAAARDRGGERAPTHRPPSAPFRDVAASAATWAR